MLRAFKLQAPPVRGGIWHAAQHTVYVQPMGLVQAVECCRTVVKIEFGAARCWQLLLHVCAHGIGEGVIVFLKAEGPMCRHTSCATKHCRVFQHRVKGNKPTHTGAHDKRVFFSFVAPKLSVYKGFKLGNQKTANRRLSRVRGPARRLIVVETLQGCAQMAFPA